MKKFIALVLAGAMLVAVPVFAAESRNASSVSGNSCESKPEPTGQAVEASSIPAAVIEAAAAEGKTVGEYLNNVLVTIPGLEYPVPIGQGGHVIINGAPSNQVFTLFKPTSAIVDSAKIFAAKLGGRLLTVARVKASVSGFRTAQVNFYMKGVRAGQNIKVFQISNGRWLEVDVIEIRDDHVVVEMTSLGTLAFIEMPSK
ncbi:MAG: hypothetical protein K2M22_01975 [Lachnospiraceae bacterium]|nr:hypothetical protein [Lachnospiraceae bacterium]MDE7177945.1 hypothetical protein [Lachnospiraceae bacterium]